MGHHSKPSNRLASRAKRCAGTATRKCSDIGQVKMGGVWYCRRCLDEITEALPK